jgi:hypothetical protein
MALAGQLAAEPRVTLEVWHKERCAMWLFHNAVDLERVCTSPLFVVHCFLHVGTEGAPPSAGCLGGATFQRRGKLSNCQVALHDQHWGVQLLRPSVPGGPVGELISLAFCCVVFVAGCALTCCWALPVSRCQHCCRSAG